MCLLEHNGKALQEKHQNALTSSKHLSSVSLTLTVFIVFVIERSCTVSVSCFVFFIRAY